MESVVQCQIHKKALLTCSETKCDKKEFCRYCEIGSKEGAKHLEDHFDNLKFKYDDQYLSDHQLNSFDGFELLNNKYLESIDLIDSKINLELFDNLISSKYEVVSQIKQNINNKYKTIKENFEKLVTDLTVMVEDVKSLSVKDKIEIKKLREQLELNSEALENSNTLEKIFLKSIQKTNKKIKEMKVQDLLDNNYNFLEKFAGFNKINLSNDLANGTNRITTRNRSDCSYWAEVSKEILKGSFFAKIKIVEINPSYANNDWYYSIGMIKADTTDFNSFYSYSIMLKSTGKAYSSGDSDVDLFTTWKTGDYIYVKRDENNTVLFGLNDEDNLRPAFYNKQGDYKILFGFMFICENDIFELEELSEL